MRWLRYLLAFIGGLALVLALGETNYFWPGVLLILSMIFASLLILIQGK